METTHSTCATTSIRIVLDLRTALAILDRGPWAKVFPTGSKSPGNLFCFYSCTWILHSKYWSRLCCVPVFSALELKCQLERQNCSLERKRTTLKVCSLSSVLIVQVASCVDGFCKDRRGVSPKTSCFYVLKPLPLPGLKTRMRFLQLFTEAEKIKQFVLLFCIFEGVTSIHGE